MTFGAYVKNAIAALATAGVLTFGGASPASASQEYRANYSNSVVSSPTVSARMTPAYGDNLVSWLDRNGYDNRTLRSLFKSDVDDSTKYLFAMALYDGMKSKTPTHDKDEEVVHLIPHQYSDGSFHYMNRMTGKIEVMVSRMPNGMFSFYGPLKWITRLGGRSELGGIRTDIADGQWFNKG